MAKIKAPSIYSLIDELGSSELKPIYFLFGEDHFTINAAIKAIEQKVSKFITSDFDKETIDINKKDTPTNLIDLAYTFPFGSEKKLLVVKNFENYTNKKQLDSYVSDPSDSTILVIANYGSISNLASDPYKLLDQKKYLFEARELKGAELENWVKKRSSQLEVNISQENIKTLIEIVGEDKSLLEMQFQKIKSFLSDKQEITTEELKSLSSATKEYSIFDLMNSLGKGEKKNSLKVIYNLLDTGKDMVYIVVMLTKYFTVISQSMELAARNLNDFDAAKAIGGGLSPYFYKNCKNAKYFRSEKKLAKAFQSLYNVDLALKTTSVDGKTLATVLLTNIFVD
ncbi:MAG: DNA polymerase III subunit delta [Ignavibacteriales bacterium]|nr:DNA polymerase III subunit delta [Ignavibacteriales bacterium]